MCDTEEVAIIIPQALKTHLEDDCVQIVKRGKVSTPRALYACNFDSLYDGHTFICIAVEVAT